MNHPSSQKNQPRFVGVMGGIAVLIAAMSFFGGLELCYSVASKTTDAKVTKQAAETRRARGGGLRHTVVVDYSFTEVSGHRRNERDELPFDSARTLGETVRVQYIPGVAGMSRMQGSTHRTLSLIMLGILGLMFVILLGIGLLNAKTGQRVKVSEEKPISVEHAAKSLTTSNVEWIGWSITGVMGLLLLTPFFLSGMRFLKFWTDYGIAWLVGVGAFAAIACILFFRINDRAIVRANRIARKRTQDLSAVACQLSFQFVPQGHDKFHQSLEEFHLATLGVRQRLSNLMHGKIEQTDVAIFDYEYVIPAGKHSRTASQTVIWLQRRGTKRTEFALRPESFWNAIGNWIGHGDINFDSHPTFSREYLLRGDDENAVRELFTDDVLTFYEQHSGLSTEGAGNKLLVYRAEVLLAPDDITSLLTEALQLLSLLEPTNPS